MRPQNESWGLSRFRRGTERLSSCFVPLDDNEAAPGTADVDKPSTKPSGRRVPAGHEPHPDEIHALLGWLDDLPPLDRYLSASDLEGLYWVATLKLAEIRAVAMGQLFTEGNSYGQLATRFGVTRGLIQKLVRKGITMTDGNFSQVERHRSKTPPPPARTPKNTLLPAPIRWRLTKAAERAETAEDTVVLAAIQAYLDLLEQESDQINDLVPDGDIVLPGPLQRRLAALALAKGVSYNSLAVAALEQYLGPVDDQDAGEN